jgi:hypothetical protein
MERGSLVRSKHDHDHKGIVMEIGPVQTRTDHGRSCVRVQWFDGCETIEFARMLEVLSAPR